MHISNLNLKLLLTRNVVYCITCEHCKLQYIGQTTRSLDERVREHIGYIRNLHTNQPTWEHFNLPGHELYHLKVSVLEKVWDHWRSLLEVRESKYSRDFRTELKGIVNCFSVSFKKKDLFMSNSLKSLNTPP